MIYFLLSGGVHTANERHTTARHERRAVESDYVAFDTTA